jgi:hypothetical protein
MPAGVIAAGRHSSAEMPTCTMAVEGPERRCRFHHSHLAGDLVVSMLTVTHAMGRRPAGGNTRAAGRRLPCEADTHSGSEWTPGHKDSNWAPRYEGPSASPSTTCLQLSEGLRAGAPSDWQAAFSGSTRLRARELRIAPRAFATTSTRSIDARTCPRIARKITDGPMAMGGGAAMRAVRTGVRSGQ